MRCEEPLDSLGLLDQDGFDRVLYQVIPTLRDGKARCSLHVHIAVVGKWLVHTEDLHQLLIVNLLLSVLTGLGVAALDRVHEHLFVDRDPLSDLSRVDFERITRINISFGGFSVRLALGQVLRVLSRVEVDAGGFTGGQEHEEVICVIELDHCVKFINAI